MGEIIGTTILLIIVAFFVIVGLMIWYEHVFTEEIHREYFNYYTDSGVEGSYAKVIRSKVTNNLSIRIHSKYKDPRIHPDWKSFLRDVKVLEKTDIKVIEKLIEKDGIEDYLSGIRFDNKLKREREKFDREKFERENKPQPTKNHKKVDYTPYEDKEKRDIETVKKEYNDDDDDDFIEPKYKIDTNNLLIDIHGTKYGDIISTDIYKNLIVVEVRLDNIVAINPNSGKLHDIYLSAGISINKKRDEKNPLCRNKKNVEFKEGDKIIRIEDCLEREGEKGEIVKFKGNTIITAWEKSGIEKNSIYILNSFEKI